MTWDFQAIKHKGTTRKMEAIRKIFRDNNLDMKRDKKLDKLRQKYGDTLREQGIESIYQKIIL